jgi:hypothetical protein
MGSHDALQKRWRKDATMRPRGAFSSKVCGSPQFRRRSRGARLDFVMTFIVETYLSRDAEEEPDRTISRTIAAAAEVDALGLPIRYLRSIFIPDDETCLLLFEADSAEVVRVTARRAGLDPDRVARADSRGRLADR